MENTYTFPLPIEAAWKAVQVADRHMVKFAEAWEAILLLADALGCDPEQLVSEPVRQACLFAAMENETELTRWAARAEAEAQAAEAGMAYLGAS